MHASWTSSFVNLVMRPNLALNRTARRRRFCALVVTGYLGSLGRIVRDR